MEALVCFKSAILPSLVVLCLHLFHYFFDKPNEKEKHSMIANHVCQVNVNDVSVAVAKWLHSAAHI